MLRHMLTDAGIGRTAAIVDGGLDEDNADGRVVGAGAGADFMQSMFVDALAQAVAGADRFGVGHVLESTLRRGSSS